MGRDPLPRRLAITRIAVALAAVGALTGCAEREAPTATRDAVPAARPEGFVRIADAMVPVAPFVIHDAKQDLFTLCQVGSEAAREQGRDLPLCYDPTARPREAVAVARVERVDATIGRALRTVAADGDGAHFAVDRTGTIYQVLDLAYAARRDGAARRDEIRIVSTAPDAHDALVATLKALWPKIRVEIIPPTPPATGGPP